MPGRLDQKEGLQKMQELLAIIVKGLQDHFRREETRLLDGFEKHGDERLASALHSLLDQHEGIRQRFTKSQQQLAELLSGGMSSHLWESSAHAMRVFLAKTERDVEEHAKNEQELLLSLRRELVKEL